ncbi:MAG: transketolase C-terminal domain-containing protein [Candidatus Binatia bacterium]|nr:transketolase C-terminal domain-containing protein [Candidatus Binatia bacterium]
MKTYAETVKEITRRHLVEDGGLLFGQCVKAVGWIGGTVPDCEGIIELPTTDVAGAAFAVGAALAGRRPIFVVRYQGFMWLNASPLVNYAAKSKAVWGQPCPVFIRAIGMEGGGVGHTASGTLHSLFMHSPGMRVAAPVTPDEYRQVWERFLLGDDPVYCSEHRRCFSVDYEMPNQLNRRSRITIVAISAARLNASKALLMLEKEGIGCDLFHIIWLKPFESTANLIDNLRETRCGLVIDSDHELCGAARSIAYDLTMAAGVPVYALGREDRVCGATPALENVTPSVDRIVEVVLQITRR